MFADKKKVQTLMEKKKAILVDMRSPILFRDDNIEGAVNLPLRNLINTLTLERDKSRPVILFGLNPDDTDLKSGVNYSENLGFVTYTTDVRQFR